MADPRDDQALARLRAMAGRDDQALARLRALAGRAAPPLVKPDPRDEQALAKLRGMATNVRPAPIVVQQPPPEPAQPVAAMISGPSPAPAPKEQGGSWWKVLSAFADPFTATLNEAAQAGYASEARGEGPLGTAGAMLGAAGRALIPDVLAPGSEPSQQGAFWEGLMSPRPVQATMFNRPGREKAPRAEKNVRAGLNFFGATVGLDPIAARIFGGVLGALGKKGAAAAQSAGLLDVAIPGVGKSVKVLKGERALRQQAKRQYVLGDAMRGIQERKAETALKQIETIYTQAQKQAGQSWAKVLPDGRRVNKADEWVTHWLEAGAPGAAHPSRYVVEQMARADGVDPAVVRQVAGIVRDRFSEMGNWLEKVGYLKPGTVARFGDQYIARTYHFASSNLDDIEKGLQAGIDGGWLTQEAQDLAQKVMRQSGLGRGTGYAPGKARKNLTAAQQEGLGREYQAGVITANVLPKQARIGARFQAVQGIADDPELFSKVAAAGWTKAKIGGRDGWWHPEALKVIENVDRFANLDQYKALRALAKVASFIRNRWVTFNPAVQEGNLKQNIVLAEGAAAAKGVHWNGAMLGEDGAWFWKIRENPMADPYFRELAERSRAFMGKGGMLGEVGGSLRRNIGIDTAGGRALKLVKDVDAAPGEVFSFVEQSAKYSLFKRLRKAGIGADEAAQAVDRALFDHADQNIILAALQKYGFIPFFGSRLKGLENTVMIAARNPDILLRQSGLRLAQASQQASGSEHLPLEDPKTGKLQFYFPGDVDAEGRQRARSGQIFSQNPFAPLTGSETPGFVGPEALLGGPREILENLGGVWQPGINMALNYDAYRRKNFPSGGGFIVRPGEVPPLEESMELAKYFLEAYAPAGVLTPGVGRGAKRIGRAFEGTTQFGGPSQEPETPMEALLGVFAGVRVSTPEGSREKMFRGRRNIQDRLPNQLFLAQYQNAVRAGSVKRKVWPEHMLPKDPMQTKDWLKNALRNLNQFTFGMQEKQGSEEQQAKLRLYSDWVMQLEDHLRVKFREQLAFDEMMELSRE